MGFMSTTILFSKYSPTLVSMEATRSWKLHAGSVFIAGGNVFLACVFFWGEKGHRLLAQPVLPQELPMSNYSTAASGLAFLS